MSVFNLAADAVNIISQKPTFLAIKQSQLANMGFIEKKRQENVLKYIQDNAEKGGRWLDAYARTFDVDPDTLRNEIYEWDIGGPEQYKRLIKEGGDVRHTVNEFMEEGLIELLGRVGAPQIPLGEPESDYDSLMEQIKEKGMTFTEEQEQRRNELVEQLSDLGIDVFRLQRNLERVRASGRKIRTELHSLESTNEQLSKALEEARKIPRPQWRFGQRVAYLPLDSEAEITDLDIQNGAWVYVVRVANGSEYVARASELKALEVQPTPKGPVSIFEANRDEILNQYGAALVERGITPERAMQIAESRADEIRAETSPAKSFEEALRITTNVAQRDIPGILRQETEATRQPIRQEAGVAVSQGTRPGEIEVEAPTFYGSTFEAKIEKERGYALTPFEERILRLPLFQAVEKNSRYFSDPKTRVLKGYPEKLEDLIRFYIQNGDLSERELRAVGLRPP